MNEPGQLVEPTLLKAIAPFGIKGLQAPAQNNLKTASGSQVSSLLVQYAPPEGVDGHYVPFVLPGPKYQYRCFFSSLIRYDKAIVFPPNDDPLAPCPTP